MSDWTREMADKKPMPTPQELACVKEIQEKARQEEDLLSEGRLALIIAQQLRVKGHDAAYWKLQCDEMVKTMGDLPKHLAVEIKRAEIAEGKLAKIKKENAVTWHDAAILAAKNRDAKLRERDQLRATHRQIQAAALREWADDAGARLITVSTLFEVIADARAEADRIEAGKEKP